MSELSPSKNAPHRRCTNIYSPYQIVDVQQALKFYGNDENHYYHLLTQYIETLDTALLNFKNSFNKENYARVNESCNTLRIKSAYVKADIIALSCEKMQEAYQSKRYGDMCAFYPALVKDCILARAFIKRKMQERDSIAGTEDDINDDPENVPISDKYRIRNSMGHIEIIEKGGDKVRKNMNSTLRLLRMLSMKGGNDSMRIKSPRSPLWLDTEEGDYLKLANCRIINCKCIIF